MTDCGPGWLAKFIPQRGLDCSKHDADYAKIRQMRRSADLKQRARLVRQGRAAGQARWRYKFRAWRWGLYMRVLGRFCV